MNPSDGIPGAQLLTGNKIIMKCGSSRLLGLTLYVVTTKDAEYKNVRLVRSSSSGFIIAREKQIIYLPAGELKSIALVGGP